jgi:hypothetical protein
MRPARRATPAAKPATNPFRRVRALITEAGCTMLDEVDSDFRSER